MSWELITYHSPDDEWVEIRIIEKGVQLSFWKGDRDRGVRTATFPWDDWEKLVSIASAMRPR